MDLVQLIESKKFLGAEFLTWIWFQTVINNQTTCVLDETEYTLDIANALRFQHPSVGSQKASIRGENELATTEMSRAVFQTGQLLDQLRLTIASDELEFSMQLDAKTLAFTSLVLPKQVQDEADEEERSWEGMAYIRIELIRRLTEIYEALLVHFITFRKDKTKWAAFIHEFRSWISETA